MADNVSITPGSGDTVHADEYTHSTLGTGKSQLVKLVDGTLGSGTPIAVASGVAANAMRTVSSTDDPILGALTETAPGTDTASSGLNGRLQRIAQRLTTLITALGTQVFGAGTAAAAQRVTHASDDPAVTALQVMDDWDNGASDGASVSGDVAHDSADAGEPVKIGGKAVSAEPTAVTANDRVNSIFDLVGKQIVLPYANPENFVSGVITSAITDTTSTLLIAAPAAGLRNYITQITISNAHATVGTDVLIQDGAGGTTLYVIPAAALYNGSPITLPTPLRQPTTATAIYCAPVTTGASIKASASGYKGV